MKQLVGLTLLLLKALIINAQVEVISQSTHTRNITALAFSPDDNTLLTSGDDGVIKFWDVKTGLIKKNLVTNDRYNLLRYSPDGSMIAATDETNYSIDIYDAKLPEVPIITIEDRFFDIISDIDFTPDSDFLYVTSFDSSSIFIDLRYGYGSVLEYGLAPIVCMDINKSLHFVSLDKNRSLKIIKPVEGLNVKDSLYIYDKYDDISKIYTYDIGYNTSFDKDLIEYEVHIDDNGNCTVIHTNYISAGLGRDSLNHDVISVWKFPNLESSKLLAGHQASIQDMEIYDQGRRLCSIDKNGNIMLWDLTTGELLIKTQLKDNNDPPFTPRSIAISPDQNYLVVTAGTQVLLLSIKNLNPIWSSRDSNTGLSLRSMSLSKDNELLGIAFDNGHILLWDMASIYPNTKIETHDLLNNVAFSPNESILAVAYENGVSIWDYSNQTKQLDLIGHHEGAQAVAFHPNQQMLASSGNTNIYFTENGQRKLDTDIILWDYEANNIVQRIQGEEEVSRFLTFEPIEGNALIADGDIETLQMFMKNENEYELIQDLNVESSLSFFNPSGDQFFICSWNEDGEGIISYSSINDETGAVMELNGHKQPIESYAFIPPLNILVTGDRMGKMVWWNLNTNEPIFSSNDHGSAIINLVFNPDNAHLYAASTDGKISCWNPLVKQKIYELIFFDTNSFAFFTSKGDYYFDKKTANPFAFQITNQTEVFPLEQFDIKYNRPDKIFQLLNPSSQLVEAYRKAYQKRLDKLGFNEDDLSNDNHLPTVEISHTIPTNITSEKHFTLTINASDERRNLDRIRVDVNNVPLHGMKGIDLRSKAVKEHTMNLDIPLSSGRNKIQVSVLNQGGAESLKATTYITYDAPAQKPNLYLLAIGVSNYQDKGKDLQYAAKDAQDIANFYQNNYAFGQTNIKTLTNKEVTKSNILALRDWLETSTVDDQVILYVSGHGLLDENYDFYYATHDIDFSKPSANGILYDEIEALLDGIPARKKLLLMDACHSGEYDKDTTPLTPDQQENLQKKGVSFKGFAKGNDENAPQLGLQNSFEMMQQLFADLRRGSGATVITSSSGVQVSFEDKDWQNGAFTYTFLNGLKSMQADANGDGEVTASEIQAFVAEYVPRLTEGLQVPTFRRENLEYDFRVW